MTPPGSKHERKKAHAQVRTLAERANTHLSSYALATRPSRPRYKHTSPVSINQQRRKFRKPAGK